MHVNARMPSPYCPTLLLILRFYYDFYVPGDQISEGDLPRIKKEMDRIISKNHPITKKEVSREDAR